MRFCSAFLLTAITLCGDSRHEPITPENISELKAAWTYDTGESPSIFLGERSLISRPLRCTRTASSPSRRLADLSSHLTPRRAARSGSRIFMFSERELQRTHDARRDTVGEVIYTATTDARLACLDRATGEQCSGFGTAGEIDLRAGLRRKPEYSGEYGVSSPPAVYKDLVIVGSFVADNSRASMATGEVRAFDAKTDPCAGPFTRCPPVHSQARQTRGRVSPLMKKAVWSFCRPVARVRIIMAAFARATIATQIPSSSYKPQQVTLYGAFKPCITIFGTTTSLLRHCCFPARTGRQWPSGPRRVIFSCSIA